MKINWKNGVSGSFATASNWSAGKVPGPADAVSITAAGNYMVTSSNDQTVLSLGTAAGATLDIIGGHFTMTAGTGTGANAGTILVENSAQLIIGGTFKNTGTIAINDPGFFGLAVAPLGVTLTGGGKLLLNGPFTEIMGGSITNVDNVISGSGALWVPTIVNQRHGVINATGDLIVGFVGGVTSSTVNLGTLEATAGGDLVLRGSIVGGGLILADGAGSRVDLQGYFSGGTFKTTHDGIIVVSAGDHTTLDGKAQAIHNFGTISVDNYSTTFLGTIDNHGTIEISVNINQPIFVNATFAGGGRIALSDNGNNLILANGGPSTLKNVDNVISGAGQIGSAELTLINQAKGVIAATGHNPLIIDTGSHVITNAGTLQATGGGVLFVASGINNSGALIANAGDLILAGVVTGKGTATITGGGVLEFGAASAENTKFVGTGGTLVLDDSSHFSGKVSGFGGQGDLIDLTDIDFGANTLLKYSGNATGGTLTVSDGSHTAKIALLGSYTQSSFTIVDDGSGGTMILDSAAPLTVSVIGVSEVVHQN